MSPFVEALKRNCEAERISLSRIDQLLADTKINQEEYNYITGATQ